MCAYVMMLGGERERNLGEKERDENLIEIVLLRREGEGGERYTEVYMLFISIMNILLVMMSNMMVIII
jgi:hypothetical protein